MCEKCRTAWAAAAKAESQKAQQRHKALTHHHKKKHHHHRRAGAHGAKAAAGAHPKAQGGASASGTQATSSGAQAGAAGEMTASESTATPATGSNASSPAESASDTRASEPARPEPEPEPKKKEPEDKPRKRAIDVDKAVATLNENAEDASQGKCAKYVREAIEAGGTKVPNRPLYAKDYGPRLVQMGFEEVSAAGYVPQKGDVVVFDPPAGQVAGHIEMWSGSRWVSDFRQRTDDVYPGPAYRKEKTAHAIYRP